MPRSKGRSGRPWERLKAQVRARAQQGEPCCICHQPINCTLRSPHPYSFSVDHLISLIEGGHPTDPANLAPAHRTCNVRKENARRKRTGLNAGRDW